MFICVSCFGLAVNTCQVAIKTSLMTPLCGEEITCTKPRLKRLFACIFLLVCLCYHVFYPALRNISPGADFQKGLKSKVRSTPCPP